MTTTMKMGWGSGLFCLLVLGACSADPVVPTGRDPSFTGYTYGSGNSRQVDTTTATVSAAGDTTARGGGYTYGSGN